MESRYQEEGKRNDTDQSRLPHTYSSHTALWIAAFRSPGRSLASRMKTAERA
jgi:hypothetical protein